MHLSLQPKSPVALRFGESGKSEFPWDGIKRVQRERIAQTLALLEGKTHISRQFIGRDHYPKQAMLAQQGAAAYILTIGPVDQRYGPDEAYFFSADGSQVSHQQFNEYLPKPSSPEAGLYGQLGQFLEASEFLENPTASSTNPILTAPDDSTPTEQGFSMVG